MTWFNDLQRKLQEQGQRPHVLHEGNAKLLVVEHGARLMAVEMPGVDHNLIFHTDATDDGMITGGDRLWLAPEAAYFWPSLDDALRDPRGTQVAPPAIDPGDYHLIDNEPPLTLWNQATLKDTRNGHTLNVNVQRHFGLTGNVVDHPDVEDCSFIIRNGVSFAFKSSVSPDGEDDGTQEIDADMGTVVGCWDLLQLPPVGTLICPTTTRVGPKCYYDPFGDRHVVAVDDCVKFLIDGKRFIKMGVAPEHTTGRMGYYRALGGGKSSLIVRVFSPLPGEPYCDLPRDHPAHAAAVQSDVHPGQYAGDALQAYNDDGASFPGTSFGEMEYHDPCLIAPGPTPGAAPLSRTGMSVTHVLVGPDAAVREAGRELLGVAVEPIE